MPGDEIEVPKELREFMLEEAEETFLGQKNGALKQELANDHDEGNDSCPETVTEACNLLFNDERCRIYSQEIEGNW